MRSFRATGLLATAVALLVAYTIYDSRREEKAKAKLADQERVVRFSDSELDTVKIVKGAQTILLKKTEGIWQLLEPLKDQGDNETINSLLAAIATEKAKDLTAEKPGPVAWAHYHLDLPGAEFEFTTSKGEKQAFAVSSSAAFDGQYFLKSGDRLLLGSSSWARHTDKSPNQLRNRKVLRLAGEINGLTIEINMPDRKEKTALIKKEGKWSLIGQPQIAIASDKVERYLTDLKGLRVLDYQPEPVNSENLKKYNLDKVTTRVNLGFAKQQPAEWIVEIGAVKDNSVYGKHSTLSAIFKMSSSDGDRLRQSVKDFRDGKLPFKVDLAQAAEIHLQSADSNLTFKKQGNEWQLTPEQTDKAADSANVEKLVQKISSLEAKNYFGPRAPFGAFKHKIEFKDQKGESLLAVSVGDEMKAKKGQTSEPGLTFAKSSLTSEVLGVATVDLTDIPFDSLVKETKTEKPASESPTTAPQPSGPR